MRQVRREVPRQHMPQLVRLRRIIPGNLEREGAALVGPPCILLIEMDRGDRAGDNCCRQRCRHRLDMGGARGLSAGKCAACAAGPEILIGIEPITTPDAIRLQAVGKASRFNRERNGNR